MKKTLTFKALGNKKRGYRQTEFVNSTFNISGASKEEVSLEGVERVIHNLKRLGLTQAELGHAHHNTVERAIRVCEKEGMNLILQDLSRFGNFQDREDVVANENVIKEVVEETKDYSCIKGYYIWDEPLWEKDLIEAGKYVDWFDKYAPGKHAFVVAIPSYNKDYTWENVLYPEYLARYCDLIQPSVLSFDYYPFGGTGKPFKDAEQLDNSELWKDLALAREESKKRDWPLWFYYQVVRMGTEKFTFPMIRVQMNYALLYGAKGLQCYGVAGSICSPDKLNEKRRIIESDFTEGCFFDDYTHQLARIKAWGRTFMALTSDHVYHSPEVLVGDSYFDEHYREDVSESMLALKELPFRCSVGVLSDDYGNQYLAILNRDYERAQSFELPLKDRYRIYEVSYADGKQYCINDGTACINVTLAEGDMVLYRLQDCGEEAFEIAYECESLLGD